MAGVYSNRREEDRDQRTDITHYFINKIEVILSKATGDLDQRNRSRQELKEPPLSDPAAPAPPISENNRIIFPSVVDLKRRLADQECKAGFQKINIPQIALAIGVLAEKNKISMDLSRRYAAQSLS